MGSTAVFRGIDNGPGSDSIGYDYGRSSGRTTLKAGLLAFVAFYLVIVAVTEDFAGVPGLPPVSRWTAAFTQWGVVAAIPLLVAAYGLLRAAGVLRRHYGLAVDPRGLWFRDESQKTFFHIPWTQIERAVSPGLRLYLTEPQAVQRCPGLKDAKGTTRPVVERGRASVRLPVSGNLPDLRGHFEQFAPDVKWEAKPGVWDRAAGTPAVKLSSAVRQVVVGLLVPGVIVAALVLGGLTLHTISGYQPGTLRGTAAGTVVSCVDKGPVGGYGVGSWHECRVEINENGRSKVILVKPPYLTTSDIGRQVLLDRFERKSEYTTYDDYTPQGSSHRNWLNYAVAVPLMVIGGLLGLLAFWALIGDVQRLAAALRTRKTGRQHR